MRSCRPRRRPSPRPRPGRGTRAIRGPSSRTTRRKRGGKRSGGARRAGGTIEGPGGPQGLRVGWPGGAPGGAGGQGGVEGMARQLQATKKQIVVEGYADAKDGDKRTASLERANRAREQLIRNGVDPSQVVAIGAGEQKGRAGGVKIFEA